MATVFLVIALLAVAAAVVSWGYAVAVARAAVSAHRRQGLPNSAATYALLVFWPFAVLRRDDEAEAHARLLSRAAVAFFVSLTLAVAATSAFTNLTMKRPSALPAPAPNQS